MPLKEQKYKYNQTIMKVYGFGENRKIKLTTMNVLRTSGVEDDSEQNPLRGLVNDEKLSENISRAKSRIFELAFCNPWDWFLTATLDPNKHDRTDLELFHKSFTQWLRDYNKKHGTNIKFVLIPELHADGKSWHMHGFLSGLPVSHLNQFCVGDVMGKSLADKVKNGDVVYNWLAYAKKFGFCDLEPIRNAEAVSKYITKYVNKSLANSVKTLNAHLYYHSRGLNVAEVKKKGTMLADIVPTYQNDYCSVSWLDYSEELFAELSSSIV